MALWSVVCRSNNDDSFSTHSSNTNADDGDSVDGCSVSELAECVPMMKPVYHFSNISRETCSLTSAGERVRGLAYNGEQFELASLQANQCAASLHLWDVFLFQQVSE